MSVGCQELFDYLILLVKIISFAEAVEIKVLSLYINLKMKVKSATKDFTYNWKYYIFFKNYIVLDLALYPINVAVFWVILYLIISERMFFKCWSFKKEY